MISKGSKSHAAPEFAGAAWLNCAKQSGKHSNTTGAVDLRALLIRFAVELFRASATSLVRALRTTAFFTVALSTGYFLAGTTVCASAAHATVRVKAEATVQADQLTLGDVAEVSAPGTAAQRLRGISLGYAPNVGAVREIARQRIVTAIGAAGFSADDVTLDMSTSVLVRRAAQSVDPQLLRSAVEAALAAQFHAPGVTAELVKLSLPASVQAPSGQIEVRATIANLRDISAPFTVTTELLVDGRVVQRLNLPAQIAVKASVLVTTHDIEPGARIREADVRSETRVITRALATYVRSLDQLRGTEALVPIAREQELSTAAVGSAIVVKTGDIVKLVGSADAVLISVTCEARSAGRIGDRVQVKNTQSGVLLQAIVVNEGVVEIKF